MIGPSDSYGTVDLGKYYTILPYSADSLLSQYLNKGGISVPEGFSYNSGTNPVFLTVTQLKNLIEKM